MKIQTIQTKKVLKGQDLFSLLDQYLPLLQDGDIVAITSKIISLCENRTIPKQEVNSKLSLIQKEADYYLEEQSDLDICLTIKNNLLIPTAGIDESNANDSYILYPQAPFLSAFKIWKHLKAKHQLQKIGVLITDSHTTPLRRGVTGIALAWCGFKALKSYVNQPDIFGRPLRVTCSNYTDGLAAAAVLMMGEGNEQTPLALIQNFKNACFQDHPPTKEEIDFLNIPLEDDLYSPLLKAVAWKKTTPS